MSRFFNQDFRFHLTSEVEAKVKKDLKGAPRGYPPHTPAGVASLLTPL